MRKGVSGGGGNKELATLALRGPFESKRDAGSSAAVKGPEMTADRLLGFGAVVVFLLTWEMMVRLQLLNPLFASSPTRIAKMMGHVLTEGMFLRDLRISGFEFLSGYLLAVVVGIPIGIVTGWYRKLNAVVAPFISALYPMPKMALMPLVVIWFGIGIWSKVAVVFLGAVFQILVNVQAGVRSVEESLITAARSFGASDRQVFTTIVLPSSVPFIMAGLRLAVGQALIGVIVGELFASTAGIGYQMAMAGQMLNTDRVFVYLIIVSLIAIVIMSALERLEKHFQSWRPDRLR